MLRLMKITLRADFLLFLLLPLKQLSTDFASPELSVCVSETMTSDGWEPLTFNSKPDFKRTKLSSSYGA